MAEELQAIPTHAAESASLTQGLARNTIFNLLGWAWPAGLAIVSVPYIVTELGTDAYGVFSIVSIVAGYLGMLSSPVAMGNVRFMAEAYAHGEWSKLRGAALGGLVINLALSALGGLIMFLAADWLARNVFAIPAALVGTAVIVFRLAAFGFVLNGAVGALESIPMAMRRYDISNQARVIVGTLNTVAIVLALWWGRGLLGAVVAQVISSALGLALFTAVAWRLLRRFPGSTRKPLVNVASVRRLVSFSSLLFVAQVISQIGLQVDRTLIGILVSTSALTFYTVPAKITDRIPSMMYAFAIALYPLSSEAVATDKVDELRRLYHEMVRILLWVTAFIATLLITLSKDLLELWIGHDFMVNSWLVLALLAASVVWRSSGSVAYQVCTGMGRADVNLIASIGTAVSMTVPVLIMAPKWGAPGVAFGVFLGLFVSNLAYDVFTQRKLLGSKSWKENLAPYIRVVLAQVAAILSYHLLSVQLAGWAGLFINACLVSCFYLGWSLLAGALAVRDVRVIVAKVNHAFHTIR